MAALYCSSILPCVVAFPQDCVEVVQVLLASEFAV